MRYEGAGEALVRDGYARVRLSSADLTVLDALRKTAAEFFGRDEVWKRAHGDEPGLFGFRPYGMQFSDDPNLKDECESFAYWADRAELIPGREDLDEFMAALRRYWALAGELSTSIMEQLAQHYGYGERLDFGPASYIEINSYGLPPNREFLQTRHEDGHHFTLVKPNKKGLEVEIDGHMRPAEYDDDEMLVMPGSLLTAMTADQIPPFYHRVRNFMLAGRMTVLFFVNTPFSGEYGPYVRGESNAGTDFAALSRQKCTLFGKPLPQVLV